MIRVVRSTWQLAIGTWWDGSVPMLFAKEAQVAVGKMPNANCQVLQLIADS
jgi:hypothetical protein